MVGTLQDQQPVPQGKNLGLQGSASSEAISEREKHTQRKRRQTLLRQPTLGCLANSTGLMRTGFLVGTLLHLLKCTTILSMAIH
jgi:hypothetical protein